MKLIDRNTILEFLLKNLYLRDSLIELINNLPFSENLLKIVPEAFLTKIVDESIAKLENVNQAEEVMD